MALRRASESMKTLITETELNAAIDEALAELPEEMASQAIAVQSVLASPGDWEAAKHTSAPPLPEK